MDRSSNLFLGGVFVAGMATTYLLRQMKVMGAETRVFRGGAWGSSADAINQAKRDCEGEGCDVRSVAYGYNPKYKGKSCSLVWKQGINPNTGNPLRGHQWGKSSSAGRRWTEECCDCETAWERREQEKAKDLAKNLSKEKKDTRMFDPEGNTLVEQFMGFFQTDPQTTMTSNAFSIGQV